MGWFTQCFKKSNVDEFLDDIKSIEPIIETAVHTVDTIIKEVTPIVKEIIAVVDELEG